jgi:hypothetical protein
METILRGLEAEDSGTQEEDAANAIMTKSRFLDTEREHLASQNHAKSHSAHGTQ